jgi:hypothetical protein
VSVEVRNDAAPRVWFLAPSDGDRLPAGEEVAVRVQGEGGRELTLTVGGTAAGSARADVLTTRWTPGEGRHRMVAVVSAPGRPDGVAAIEVVGVPPGPAPAGAAPDPAPGSPATPAYLPGTASAPSLGGVVPVARSRIGDPVASGGGGALGPPATVRSPDPPSGGPTPQATGGAPAHGTDDGDREGRGLGARIAAFLSDPERVAWSVGLPLLLIAAGAGYLLLQRFIDGGQKLAWRGRGRPDDTIVEF